MSYSTVKAGLDDIATAIRTERQAASNAKARLSAARNNLNSLVTTHTVSINEINAYVGTDPAEAMAKDELAKLTTEFLSLVSELDGIVLSLEHTAEI